MHVGIRSRVASVLAMAVCVGMSGTVAQAAYVPVVRDTWQDATRTDPASPVYSENGVDSDADGDLESAWYRAGTGSTTSMSAGHMIHSPSSSPNTNSLSITTYFTPEATPITLAATGEKMRLTWVFSMTGVNSTSTGNQDFRLAILNSPAAARISADGSPGSAAYAGYGMFGNLRSGNLGSANSFRLMEWVDPNTANNMLSTAAAYAQLANGANASTPGYANGVSYTFTAEFTRTAAGLDISMTMAGAGLGGVGVDQISTSFSDATPGSYTFDTFSVRPGSAAVTAASFDTTNFTVEYSAVPEPASLAVLAMAGAASLRRRR